MKINNIMRVLISLFNKNKIMRYILRQRCCSTQDLLKEFKIPRSTQYRDLKDWETDKIIVRDKDHPYKKAYAQSMISSTDRLHKVVVEFRNCVLRFLMEIEDNEHFNDQNLGDMKELLESFKYVVIPEITKILKEEVPKFSKDTETLVRISNLIQNLVEKTLNTIFIKKIVANSVEKAEI